MKALVLRVDSGPLMSFGGVMVDQHGFIDRFPGLAMLTGLLGNAFGWDHRHTDRLQVLQERLEFAARWDVPAHEIVDYQTVDLSQRRLAAEGWTTRGKPEHRSGGPAARFGTHQRYRHYWVDGLMTLVVTLRSGYPPTLEETMEALRHPERPLFWGRKACLPARPILDPSTPLVEGPDLLTILRRIPVWDRTGRVLENPGLREACWPSTLDSTASEVQLVYDLRDWRNQLFVGARERRQGMIGGLKQ